MMEAMSLPLELPLSPMLAKSVDQIPEPDAVEGGYAYEPKWDGFRCILSREGTEVVLGSRSLKPLTRYFPEVVSNALQALPEQVVLDAELVVRRGVPGAEHLDWEALSQRIHPADSRVNRLSEQTPAELVCFDLLALGQRSLLECSYDQRRAELVALFGRIDHPGIHLSANTLSAEVALDWFERFEGAGLDGVVIKARRQPYQPGRRAMLKIKHRRTAEAVVVGYRVHKGGRGVGSLLLGMYEASGELIMVGGIGAFSAALRESLEVELAPLVAHDSSGLPMPAAKPRSRFASAADASYIPLQPLLVVEVAFDQLEGRRFRHAVSLVRFRPDREPASCLIDQVDRAARYDLAEVLAAE